MSGKFLLGIDTCGASGSIALGRVDRVGVTIVGEAVIPGGELSILLVQAIAEKLAEAGVTVSQLGGIIAVAGPGSFTGIRVGLAVVKGLAEAGGVPVVALSRLALLAELAGAPTAVLDAHRGQVFCRLSQNGGEAEELLLTAGEINAMGGLTGAVGVCEESVAQALEELRGEPELVRVASPTAADALRFRLGKWLAGDFADVETLDGYYLRGADAKMAGARA